MPDTNPNAYSIATPVSAPATITPQVTLQSFIGIFPIAQQTNFDFAIDSGPIFDVYVFADQAMTVRIFIRISTADAFRQLGADIVVPASTPTQALTGRRLPGSFARIQFNNLSGVQMNTVSIEAHARSI